MIYFVNAFSLNMIEINGPTEIQVILLGKEDVIDFLANQKYISAIGHKETADILTNMLGIEVKHNRMTVKIDRNDIAVIAQYKGPRLKEGATKLPEGAKIEFYIVRVKEGF